MTGGVARAGRRLPGAAVAACLLLAALLAGCTTPEARHEVLTFFFTGVPDLVEPMEVGGVVLSEEEARAAIARSRERAKFKPPNTWAHAPAAANQCQFCHQMGSDKGGVGARKIGPEMVATIDKLCIGCHDDKGKEFAESLGMVSHKPVSNGMCVACHDPHQGPQRYMLRLETRQKLCMVCHTGKENFAPIPPPGPHAWVFGLKIECTECHNPHFGKTSRMFRAHYDERRQRYKMDRAGGSSSK